jgi:transposase InsO family protein
MAHHKRKRPKHHRGGCLLCKPQKLPANAKVERLHQTSKRYLARQAPAKTLAELQIQLDAFAHYYNAIRPHRALGGRTPLQAS